MPFHSDDRAKWDCKLTWMLKSNAKNSKHLTVYVSLQRMLFVIYQRYRIVGCGGDSAHNSSRRIFYVSYLKKRSGEFTLKIISSLSTSALKNIINGLP